MPFVIDSLLRYQHLVLREQGGGDPGGSLIRDEAMMAAISGGALAAAFIVYAR